MLSVSEVGQKKDRNMSETTQKDQVTKLQAVTEDILSVIDQEREREIITRRFGLYERRETLEQIGELLGITRERVRQLEKAILTKLKAATSEGKVPTIANFEKVIIRELSEMGRVARVQDLADRILGGSSDLKDRARVAFIAPQFSPRLANSFDTLARART